MTQPVSRPPSVPEADSGPVEPITEFVAHDPGAQQAPHSSIEREIARSERASAALAATRALARAAFTDSQLAADDAAAADADGDEDADDAEWVRTEYVALEQTLPPDDEARRDTPRNLVGGSFNPGIESQRGRTFPGASMADASLKTRAGAQAQFHHEARHAPRAEGLPAASGHPARPVVTPSQAAAPSRSRSPARAPARTGVGMLLAAGLCGVVILAGGGLAWRAGMLSHAAAPVTAAAKNAPAATAPVSVQAEAARVLSPAAPQEIPVTPAAGPTPPRSEAEVDAALAAAARAAAVPAASVRAAGPATVAPPQPQGVPVPAITPAPAAHGKASVAAAIANAQAKADRFLSSNSGDASAPVPTGGKPAQ
jgi:hypothetical protein